MLRRVTLIVLAVLLGFGLSRPAKAEAPNGTPLTVTTAAGSVHRFQVELAVTPDQQARGLMFRTKLAPEAGMLFLYRRPTPTSFWMRNTLIPLDMIFIAEDGRILNIHAQAQPLDESPKQSDGPVIAVLEIGGGLAGRLGIRPGDRVEHPALAVRAK